MCGIVACSSAGEPVSDQCVAGLRRLQYRGYDSFGFAWCQPGGDIGRLRSLDALDEMVPQLPHATVALGHTRWATHGAVSLENGHPHIASGGDFALVHNGIVENFQALKSARVAAGRAFTSETDTEVIVACLEQQLAQTADRRRAIAAVLKQLEGRNTLVAMFADGEIYGIRQGSPLVLGRGEHTLFLASDVLSFAPWTTRCFILPEAWVVRIADGGCNLYDASGEPATADWQDCEVDPVAAGLDGFRHYMLKEVMEQWNTVAAQAMVTDEALSPLVEAIHRARTVVVTGAGGAYYAARQVAWFLRNIAGVHALDAQAYEFDAMASCVAPGDLLLAISQSGETADTLEAVRMAADRGMEIASLVNMPMSTLSNLSRYAYANRSGPEICVLSTKSAMAQLTFGYLLANATIGRSAEARANIQRLSHRLSQYLCDERLTAIQPIARRLSAASHLFVLGKGGCYSSALTGALNIKEASYLHAEAFAAGELKHGVIALIEPGTPVLLFVPEPTGYLLNVAAEVKARGAFLVGIGVQNNELFDGFIPLPELPTDAQLIASIVPCQLLAYFIAVERGLNPDKPRNLAKSVTVQ